MIKEILSRTLLGEISRSHTAGQTTKGTVVATDDSTIDSSDPRGLSDPGCDLGTKIPSPTS